MPNDAIRVNYLIRLIEAGYDHQLVISEDICGKQASINNINTSS